MKRKDDWLELLTEIRDNQRTSLQRQEEHLAIVREQMDKSRQQVDQSIALQRQAIDRFKRILRLALPAIILCVALLACMLHQFS